MSEERFYTIRPRRRPVADSDGNEWPSVRDAALAVSGAVSAESCISLPGPQVAIRGRGGCRQVTEQQCARVCMLLAFIGLTVCELLAAPSVETTLMGATWLVAGVTNAVLYVIAEVREAMRWRGR